MDKDARIRFGDTDLLGCHQVIDKRRQPETRQLDPLFADEIVGHDDDGPATRSHGGQQRGGAGNLLPVKHVGLTVGLREPARISVTDQCLKPTLTRGIYREPSGEHFLMKLLQQNVMLRFEIFEGPPLQSGI